MTAEDVDGVGGVLVVEADGAGSILLLDRTIVASTKVVSLGPSQASP